MFTHKYTVRFLLENKSKLFLPDRSQSYEGPPDWVPNLTTFHSKGSVQNGALWYDIKDPEQHTKNTDPYQKECDRW